MVRGEQKPSEKKMEERLDDIKMDIESEIIELKRRMDNIYRALSHVISETGTGRILDKYGIEPYDLTEEDLSRGKYKPVRGKK